MNYIIRELARGEVEELPDIAVGQPQFKALVFVSESAMKSWEDFSRNLLTHVNPYTRLAWKDDPAIVTISLINEDTIFAEATRDPRVAELYRRKFKEWAAARKIAITAENQKRQWEIFLSETYMRGYRRMSEFLRNLGVRALLTDQNMWATIPVTLMRNDYDLVDNHFYDNHPSFLETPWRLPMSIENRSVISAFGGRLAYMFPSRIFGKPFTITEYNWCYPNRFRGEGGVLIGAYSALQGYDGIYRFAYAHDKKFYDDGDYEVRAFDTANDLIALHGDRIAALLFRRGDAAESNLLLPVRVRRSESRNAGDWPEAVQYLGLAGKTGSIVEQASGVFRPVMSPAVALPGDDLPGGISGDVAIRELGRFGDAGAAVIDVEKKFSRSSTGEIELDGTARTLKVMTPFSEALVLSAPGKLEGRNLSVDAASSGVFCAAALDEQNSRTELTDSKRIVFFHLTDQLNSNTHFMNRDETVMDQYGNAPRLIRVGKAAVQLRLKGAPSGTYRVYPLHLDGSRQAPIESVYQDGVLSFEANTGAGEEPALAYEIVLEQ